ncbi:MAG: YIP1 family protein [Gemmatimonadales bacterium]
MDAVIDLVRVLYEPTAVFERLREKPRILLPMIAVVLLSLVLGFLTLPYLKVAMRAVMPAQATGGPSVDTIAMIQVVSSPIFVVIFLLLAAGVMWVAVSLLGAEGKYKLLLGVATYAAILYVLQLLAGYAVLTLRGIESVTSPQDLQPAFGLDLLAPGMTGYLGAVLKGINVFSVWGVVLEGIGISVTHRVSKGTGYIAAGIAFVVLLLVLSLFGLLQPSTP